MDYTPVLLSVAVDHLVEWSSVEIFFIPPPTPFQTSGSKGLFQGMTMLEDDLPRIKVQI